jgi:hypothetical protein
VKITTRTAAAIAAIAIHESRFSSTSPPYEPVA